ncbi:uncharacterized protein LOC127872871 isoform X2 [Dreissena polymorpha]|uniref:uncharacterized protein LOC127872871 isoform X2 n=1 Tax=Dreissena polymorpha TaxID=45954 RepID=UPI002263CAA7|nr:uncharacterized protein LOC127872871 isoform X2 [Dreissena polymorpha]
MDHYIKAIVVLCLALSHVTCQLSNEPADVPENFNTTSTDLGNEQQIKVVAPNGKLLATIEVFTEEGFEVQKPTDRNKCLMSKILPMLVLLSDLSTALVIGGQRRIIRFAGPTVADASSSTA